MKNLYVLLSLLAVLASCSEDNEITPDRQLALIGSATSAHLSTEAYARDSLSVGYNVIQLKLKNQGKEDPSIRISSLTPIMTMKEMSHSAPVERLEGSGDNVFGVVFTMPGGADTGFWEIHLELEANGESQNLIIPVGVKPSVNKLKTFIDENDQNKIFVALIEPAQPSTGINDFEVAVFKKESADSWPAVTGYDFFMTPSMPAMDHGSPNNTDPVHTGGGHYQGKVNFTMDGLWRIALEAKKGETHCGEVFFDIEF